MRRISTLIKTMLTAIVAVIRKPNSNEKILQRPCRATSLSKNNSCSLRSALLLLIFLILAVILASSTVHCSIRTHLPNRIIQGEEENTAIKNFFSNYRGKRLPQHIISDCILVVSKPGQYSFKTTKENYDKENTVCGIYFMVDPDEIVQIQFDFMDMPCSDESLVAFVDGWELNGSYFPSEEDYTHPVSERFKEYCGRRRIKQLLESTQNAALIQYRVPKLGKGFSFQFSTRKNPMPCHVLVESPSYVYTLRNYGKQVNCSLMSMNPAKIKVLALTVGVGNKRNMEIGTFHDCEKKGMTDYVQIGGGTHLSDLSFVMDSICGVDSISGDTVDTVFCGVTTIRLISSGAYNNQITVGMQKLIEDDPGAISGIMCPNDVDE